ncbi:c-type cytochrome [Parafilimonas sp.]|uniref:c-type cytochrome n=1 Tax=Parafilimonas sp. TaxID=1969739 RepID=UPI0039E32F09
MKIRLIIFCLSAGLVIAGCSDVRRDPGRVYVPDMGPSRAYETYDALDSNKFTQNLGELGRKIFYNHTPVAGTVARGEELPFMLAKDAAGDTTNYVASKQIENPVKSLDSVAMKEAERLYLINCGICHGAKLDGNGPLYKDGNGPFPAAPKNFIGDQTMINMPAGQMFYSVTYGKNLMGSYASQLTRTQRWEIIAYIKSKQAKDLASKAPAATDSTTSK